jgi:hypothetical protein
MDRFLPQKYKSNVFGIKKVAIILDTHPNSPQKRERLIQNLDELKNQNLDVILTSRYPCDSEVISKSDHFIWSKRNEFLFLDSHILNHNICSDHHPVYGEYFSIGDVTFWNRLVRTQWSVSICSAKQSAINYLWGRGYNYGFYLIDDFICPKNFSQKLYDILDKSKSKRNYFIKNKNFFSGWFSPWFFGFTIDDQLINKIPKNDLSQNEIFQKYYPNSAHEDFINKLWSGDNNYIDEHNQLDTIFGENNWDIDHNSSSKGPELLHKLADASIYVSGIEPDKFLLLLNFLHNNHFLGAKFFLELVDQEGTILKTLEYELVPETYYLEDITHILHPIKKLYFHKKVLGFGSIETNYEDTIIIDLERMDCYRKLKYFQ